MSLYAQIVGGSTTGAQARTAINSLFRGFAKYTNSTANQADSLVHAPADLYSMGDRVTTWTFDETMPFESGAVWEVTNVGNQGTAGQLVNGGATGLKMYGANYTYRLVLGDGDRIDVRKLGWTCVAGDTDWEVSADQVYAYCKNQRAKLTGPENGCLSCTRTHVLDRVPIDMETRWQLGTKAGSGAGSPTFFTAPQANAEITFTGTGPLTVSLASHGFANGKEVMLSSDGKLPGDLRRALRYYVVNADADTFQLASSAGGAALGNADAGFGTHYVFYSPSTTSLPSQSGIQTWDRIQANGKIVRLGVGLKLGLNGSNSEQIQQRVVVFGDGNFDRSTPPSTLNILHEGDDSPNAEYRYNSNYGYIGLGIAGQSEKSEIHVKGVYNRLHVNVLRGASADSLHVHVHGNNCQAWWVEDDAVECTLKGILACETTDDPRLDAGSEGAPLPAVDIRNAKITVLGGMLRASNHETLIRAESFVNANENDERAWASGLMFDNLRVLHGADCVLDLRSILFVSGTLIVEEYGETGSPESSDSPAFRIGRVGSAAGLTVVGYGLKNDLGLEIGIDAADCIDGEERYPAWADLGRWAIHMGTQQQFIKEGALHPTKGFATGEVAVHAKKMVGCEISLRGSRGAMTFDAACTDNDVEVGRQMTFTDHIGTQYTITDAGTGNSISLRNGSTTGLNIV